jgi:hypothetical protein
VGMVQWTQGSGGRGQASGVRKQAAETLMQKREVEL